MDMEPFTILIGQVALTRIILPWFSSLQLLILFFIFQRYFIEGATGSVVKGWSSAGLVA